MCPSSDMCSVDCCFCEIALKSNFMCNDPVQRRHHYHLVNKKRVLPIGHLRGSMQELLKNQVKQANSLIETASVGADPPPYQDGLASYSF